MRKYSALIALSLALSVMIGTAFVVGNTVNVVEVDVWIWPQFLTVDGYHNYGFGEWVTAFITLPRGYSTRDVDLASITLQVYGAGTVPVSNYYTILGRIIIAKFDRAQVIDLLRASQGHMTPYPVQKVTLVVTGDMRNGNIFRGEDTITVYFVNN